MKKLSLFLAAATFSAAVYAVPLLINYQGVYVDNAGVPVTQASTPVVISIWDDVNSTNPANRKYQEEHTSNVNDGNFSLKIGSGNNTIGTFNAALFDTATNLYLQLTINGEVMLPRVRFLSAPYTLQSENSAKLGNQPIAYFASAADLTTLQNNLNAEVTNRGTDVDTEESARIAADTNLQNQINSANTAISNEVTNRTSDVNSEESARIAADTNLQNQINSANTAISNEVTNRTNDVNSEESARTAADTNLQNQINSANTAISNEVTNRTADVDAEESARTAADTANQQAMCKASFGSVWVSSLNLCVGGSVNLSNVNLSSQSLGGVHLYKATITKTNFNGATLSGAFWNGVTYTTTTGNQPTFASASLTNATITGMSLTNINLSSTALSNLYTNNISVCPAALPTGWSCVTYDGSLKRLIGPYARFYALNGELPPANWSNITFPANLTGVNFSYNQFHTCSFNSSTNFTNAILRGATFVDCDIQAGGTVTWSNTICPDGSNSSTNGKGSCLGRGM